MFNYLYFLKKYLNLLFSIIVVAFAIAGSYGVLKLLGYLDSMGNGIEEQVIIHKHLFSAPIFLLFVPVVIRFWRKLIKNNVNFQKNAVAASIAIYISIFIIGGMVSRTIFAKRAEAYGYKHCLGKQDADGSGNTGRMILARPKYTIWMPEDGC